MWISCRPPIRQQVSHQRWIWGIYCTQPMENTSEWIHIGLDTKTGLSVADKKYMCSTNYFLKTHARNPHWLWNPGQMSSEVQNRLVSDTTRTNPLQYFLIFFLKMVRIGEKVKEVEWTNVPPAANSAGHCTSKSVANKKDSCSTNSFFKDIFRLLRWTGFLSASDMSQLIISGLTATCRLKIEDWKIHIDSVTICHSFKTYI